MAQELQGRLIGGWRVGEHLGSGGSALVLRGKRGERDAALKIIDPELEAKFGSDRQEARIGYEVKLVGRCHPHLVQIFDGGRCAETGLLFVAMEYLPFPNLDEAVRPFPRNKITRLIDQIAQAARFLEELGICHRDIKPENIVVTPDFERAILLDLGILRPLNPGDQDAGTGDSFIGTVRYSPPEFVWRREEDTTEAYRAITFYQIGAVLHDLIMGRRIFCDVTGPVAALIESVTNQAPTIDAPNVDQGLLNLARDCLQKDWRTRLQLVSWSSFEITGAPAMAARERVRAVLAGSTGSHARVTTQIGHDRAALSVIGRLLRDQLRSVCLRNEEFPRAAVDYRILVDRANIWAEFEASTAHQLQNGARLTVSAMPVGGQVSIVTATGAWGEPGSNTEWKRLATLRSNVDDVSEQLEEALYLLIANAMANPHPAAGSAIQLS